MKIRFLAMSGVRVENPELLALGLTLPGFVERSEVIASLPSLSLLTLAALTPETHDVEYVEVADVREGEALDLDCDLVAISSLSAQIRDAYALADRYRNAGVRVVMGGLHVTACPEEALLHCDAVVAGEGERMWPRVVQDFERGSPRRYYQDGDPAGFDLADAPVPRFDLLDPSRYNRLTVQTSRGCPHRCEFCASSILLTSRYKVKPPERVMAEVRAIKAMWDRPFIEFADDNSFANRAVARRLLESLADEDLRWFTELDISVGDDLDLLGLMRDAGCRQVLVGLESPRPESLEGIELRSNWKRSRFATVPRNVARIQSHGIKVIGCFVVGLDGDTPGIFREVLHYARQVELANVQVTFLTPFPGTPLYDRLLREGRMTHPGAWERCTLFDLSFSPLGMSADELQEGLMWLMKALYSEEETRARKTRFAETLSRSPHAHARAAALTGGTHE